MKKHTLVLLLVLSVMSVFMCQKQPETENAPPGVTVSKDAIDLEKAVIRQPVSMLSAKDELRFQFREPLVPDHFVGHTLDKNPFTFEPKVEGYAIWKYSTVLVFVPTENMPAGTKIKGVLHGKIALGEQKNVNDLEFSFNIVEQEIIGFNGDFVPVAGQRNTSRLEGQIEFSQPVNLEQISHDLKLRGPEGKLEYSLTPNTTSTVIKIESQQVSRDDKGKSYSLKLPRKYTADKEPWEVHIPLPGIKEFKIIAHMDMTETNADQYTYGFRFNEPIKSGMDLSGFVTITPDIDFTMKTEGRYLLVSGNFVPGREYHMNINKGFPSVYENQLSIDYKQVFSLDNIKPEIQWLSEGVYLPTSNEYKLQFKSVNVARVKLRIIEILPQNVGFFVQENMLSELRNNDRYYRSSDYRDLGRVGVEIHKQDLEITTERNKWINTELDLSPTFKGKKNSVFVVNIHFDEKCLTGRPVTKRRELTQGDLYFSSDDYYNHPSRSGYYYQNGNKSKLLISSDIGLTVKKAGDGLHVFAMNVVNAKPVPGLELKLYGYQNQVLETGTTNADGYVFFKHKEYRGYIYGRDESGMALVRINHPSWEMNAFDVGGQAGARNGVDAFIYTDRGVHRPGDVVHLAAIIRFERKNPPADQPVMLTVLNPLGQRVLEKKEPCGNNGHIYFQIPTNLDDPTGDWTANINIAQQQFSKRLKIETVKPNRLKIYADIPAMLEKPGNKLTGNITSTYLFGAPAAGLKVEVDAVLVNKDISSEKYSDFTFTSPLLRFDQQYRNILATSLDDNGKCDLDHEFSDLHNANGLLRAAIHTRVYEKGGSFTENYKNTTVDPFGAYAGIKDVFKWNSVKFQDKAEIPIIVVNARGEALSGRKLNVEVFVNRHYWWWHYDRHNRQNYMQSKDTFRISHDEYTSGSDPVLHSITFEDFGSHYIQVTDIESGHRAGIFVRCSRWGRRMDMDTETDERNILAISSDKNVYNAGDQAVLTFDTPEKGTAFLTLEQGDKIMHREWKNITGTTTSFKVDLDLGMVPNVYAVIYVVQPHDARNNDLPTRLYGVKTLNVEDENTRLPLFIRVPEKLEPKKDFTLTVRSMAKKPATFTIAVVDEGLLDLTNYKTPKPWDYFFQKIRLAVQTLDNFDDIIGMLFPDMDKLFTIGGGVMEEAMMKRVDRSQVQRFVPVVLYQAPMSISPGKDVDVTFTMPNYVGSVRVMMVGASGNSYVDHEETVPVKQPLMVLPDIPRVARPGDVFDLPVSVFAMEDYVKNVAVDLQLSSNLVADTNRASLNFSKIGDQSVSFKVKVGNRVGGDTLTVLASSDTCKADYTVTLPITSANPFYTEVTDTVLMNDADITFIPEPFGLTGTNAAKLVFSRIPNINFDERLRYLIRYPYGCLEQTTSSVFPQLFLTELIDIRDFQKNMVTNNINAAIQRLGSFRLTNGFSYWPNSSHYHYTYNDWNTSYAGHFMTLAKEKGYHVPDDLYNHWLSSQHSLAKRVNTKNHRYQTYRLFSLALAGKPEMGAMNLVRENYLNKLDPLSRKFLAASYYLAGQKDAARQVDQAQHQVDPYREMSGTYGSALRDRAMLAYLCLIMDDIKNATLLMNSIAREYNSAGWYSTQETAMIMLAASTLYTKTSGVGGDPQFRVEVSGAKTQKQKLERTQMVVDLDRPWGKEVKVSTESKEPLYVSLQVEGVPIEDKVKTENNGLAITRSFFNDEGYPMSVNELKQGQSFWVKYTVTNDILSDLEELALTSLFPSGWEILNQRLTGADLPAWVRKAKPSTGEYMDIRDDRVNWFFDLRANQSQTFMVQLSATFSGEYRLPPVSVEPMYSPEYYARLAGFTTVIK